jgi:hypothetical protein
MAILPGTGTRINGHIYDWSSVNIDCNGRFYGGISEINYTDKLDVGELRGSGAIRLGTTRGQYSAEGSFTIAKEDWEPLRMSLTAMGFGGFGEARFLIVCSYREVAAVSPITDTIETCRVINVENSHSQGTDPLMVKITLDVHRIGHNGNYLVNDLEAQAVGL